MKSLFLYTVLILLGAAASAQSKADLSVVRDIDPERYYGTWYEIARMDNPVEKGLEEVTAEYRKNPDGTVTIINRGVKPDGKLWSAEGRIKMEEPPVDGRFKAVYFRFYPMHYNVLELDAEGYSWALVGGNSPDRLWILSRKPTLPKETLDHLLRKARERGFDPDKLVYPKQR